MRKPCFGPHQHIGDAPVAESDFSEPRIRRQAERVAHLARLPAFNSRPSPAKTVHRSQAGVGP
jgi:hypothetical protein